MRLCSYTTVITKTVITKKNIKQNFKCWTKELILYFLGNRESLEFFGM